MTTIKLDETTAQALAEAAKSLGITVQEYLRSRVLGSHAVDAPRRVDFDAELEDLLFSGPSLPAEFSRADIYSDHE